MFLVMIEDADCVFYHQSMWSDFPHHDYCKSNQSAFPRYQHLIKPAPVTIQAVWWPLFRPTGMVAVSQIRTPLVYSL